MKPSVFQFHSLFSALVGDLFVWQIYFYFSFGTNRNRYKSPSVKVLMVMIMIIINFNIFIENIIIIIHFTKKSTLCGLLTIGHWFTG